MFMRRRLLASLTVVWFSAFSCSVAQAQVADKILVNIVSWVLQKQIDEWDKANDPNRGLREYDGRNSYNSGNHFAPREQPIFQPATDFRGYNRDDQTPRQESPQAVVPVTQERNFPAPSTQATGVNP